MKSGSVTRYDDGIKTFNDSGKYWRGKNIEMYSNEENLSGVYTLVTMEWKDGEWKPNAYGPVTSDNRFWPVFYEQPNTPPIVLDESRADDPWAATSKNG